MSMYSNPPGRPELRAIDGDGEEDQEGRLKRARAAVESALGLRHKDQAAEGPYGHLSPVPSPEPEQSEAASAAEAPSAPAAGNTSDERTESGPNKVTRISEAPSYRARQIDAPGIYDGTSALEDRPMPVSADGEIDGRYHRIRDARLEADAAHDDMPPSIGISQMEDLFK